MQTRRRQRLARQRLARQHGGGLGDILKSINGVIQNLHQNLFGQAPPPAALLNASNNSPEAAEAEAEAAAPAVIEHIDEQLVQIQKIQKRQQVARALLIEARRRRETAAAAAAAQAELRRQLEEEARLAKERKEAERQRQAEELKERREKAAAEKAAAAKRKADAAAAEKARKDAEEAAAKQRRELAELEKQAKSAAKRKEAIALLKKAQKEQEELVKQAEEDRARAEERETRRRQEVAAAAAAAKAAAEAAAEEAKRQEELKAVQDTILGILQQVEQLAEQQEKEAAAAAAAAAKEAAAAAAEAALRELRKQVITAAAESAAAAITKQEAATKPIRNYEEAIDKKAAVMLRNKSLQRLTFMFLSELNRVLYESERARPDLLYGLSADLAAQFTTPANIKKHIFRFFVKGGSAAALLFNLKDKHDIYKFTSDIDTIILINPALSAKNYNQLHANIIMITIKLLEQFLVTTVPAALNASVRDYIGEKHNQQPTVLKYIGTTQGMVMPPDVDHGQLAPEVNMLADYLATHPFPILAQLEQNDRALLGERLTIVNYLMEQENIKESFLKTITSHNKRIANLERIKQQNGGFLPPMQFQQQVGLQIEVQALHVQIQALQVKIDSAQTNLNAVDQRKAANDELLTKGRVVVSDRLLTYILRCNHGYSIPMGSPDPPAPFIRVQDSRFKYINETLLAIRACSKDYHKIDLIDIVIPFRNNIFLADDWKYWSVRQIEIRVPGQPVLRFDVADESYTLFDQNRAARGSEGIAHLAEKYASRKARMEYLQAQVGQLLGRRDRSTRKAVRRFKKLMPAENFDRIFPEGAAAAAASASASASSGSSSSSNH